MTAWRENLFSDLYTFIIFFKKLPLKWCSLNLTNTCFQHWILKSIGYRHITLIIEKKNTQVETNECIKNMWNNSNSYFLILGVPERRIPNFQELSMIRTSKSSSRQRRLIYLTFLEFLAWSWEGRGLAAAPGEHRGKVWVSGYSAQ